MPTLRERTRQTGESFWFLPIALVVAGAVLAQATVALDRSIDTEALVGGDTTFFSIGVEGSRGLLIAIAGSVLAAAATSFSITISVIAVASSTYGPRLVRNFMADRRNQFVLGTFLGTFVFALLVLRSINAGDGDGSDTQFVPYVAVHLAIGLALLNVCVLIYFIHHIADSIQVATLVQRVRKDLRQVIQNQYPPDRPKRAVDADRLGPAAAAVMPGRSGYIVSVDEGALLEVAREHGGVIEMVAAVGTHVLATEAVARTTCDAEATEGIRSCVVIDETRTPFQDVGFAVQQLVEVAVRAISPAFNDPYTARNAISELGPGMTALARNGMPPLGRTDGDGELRLLVARIPPIDLVDGVFDDLRTYGSGHPYVVRSTIKLAGRIVSAGDSTLAERARFHVELLVEEFSAGTRFAFDVERMRAYAVEHLGDGLTFGGGPARE